MIKLNSSRLVRQTTAPFEYTNDAGEIVTEQIRVFYRMLTVGERKQQMQRIKDAVERDDKSILWLSETLADVIDELPDILGDDGKPIAITIENLDRIAAYNLDAIDKAITADLTPKEQASKLPNGTSSPTNEKER